MATQLIPGFRGRNRRAQRFAQRNAGKMVTRVSRETRAALRQLIVRAIREGVAPYTAAREIAQYVGLNVRQAATARAYRRDLERSGLAPTRVAQIMELYTRRKIRERAVMIARTEILRALNYGKLEGWLADQEEGLLSEQALKELVVTPDEKLCDVCEPLDGEAIPLDEDFETDEGDFDAPPFHPNCRCTIDVIVETV